MGIEPLVLLRDLEHRFATALRVTYRFAEQSAIRELRELRARQPSPPATAIRKEDTRPGAARERFRRLAGQAVIEVYDDEAGQKGGVQAPLVVDAD